MYYLSMYGKYALCLGRHGCYNGLCGPAVWDRAFQLNHHFVVPQPILWSLNSLRAVRLFATARCWICAGKLINVYITINYNYVSAHDGHVYLRKSLYRVHYPEFLPWTRTDFDPLIL